MMKFACAAAVAALAAPFAAFAEEAPATPAPAAPAASSTAAPPAATPPAQTQASAGAQANYTDAQVRAFAAASDEITPVQRAAGSSALTPAQVDTIRAALGRHHLDGATYNAMAQRLRTDTQFAARVDSLRPATRRE
jgi:hypothetical protein